MFLYIFISLPSCDAYLQFCKETRVHPAFNPFPLFVWFSRLGPLSISRLRFSTLKGSFEPVIKESEGSDENPNHRGGRLSCAEKLCPPRFL